MIDSKCFKHHILHGKSMVFLVLFFKLNLYMYTVFYDRLEKMRIILYNYVSGGIV